MWLGTSRQLSGSNELGQLDKTFSNEDVFRPAEALRIRLRGTMIREDRDKGYRGDNDLMIVTKYAFGADPLVDRLHFMGTNNKPGWYGDFFDDVIFSLQDLREERFKFRLQIYDLDGVNQELVDSVKDFSATSAVTFPPLALYAGIVGLGVQPLVELVNNIDDHDPILDQSLILEIDEPDTGHKLLQPGYFVCFNQDSVEGKVSLSNDLRVKKSDSEAYRDGSYAVLEVDKKYEAQREVDQKVAKLVSQLQGKGRSENSALDFLRDTLDAYTTFKKLTRAKELESKETRTREEENLLKELKKNEELQPYLKIH